MSRNQALEPVTPSTEQADRNFHSRDVQTQARVCARLGISDETWRRWRAAGKTPEPVRLPNGRFAWRTCDIDRLVGLEPERPARRQYFGVKSATHVRQSQLRAVGVQE
jgi:predicted DNA-binding transcriptional regulator AlpA